MNQENVIQVAYTTMDVAAAAQNLAEIEGVGPSFLPEFPIADLIYRGARVQYSPLQVAFG